MSNSDSSAGGTSDMKYQKCKIYITVINRTQTVQVDVHNNYYMVSMQLYVYMYNYVDKDHAAQYNVM